MTLALVLAYRAVLGAPKSAAKWAWPKRLPRVRIPPRSVPAAQNVPDGLTRNLHYESIQEEIIREDDKTANQYYQLRAHEHTREH